jgi:hypothetical protein
MAFAANAMLGQFPPGRRIHRIANLLPADCRRVDLKFILKTCLADQILQNKFTHGTSANIAVAYK